MLNTLSTDTEALWHLSDAVCVYWVTCMIQRYENVFEVCYCFTLLTLSDFWFGILVRFALNMLNTAVMMYCNSPFGIYLNFTVHAVTVKAAGGFHSHFKVTKSCELFAN